MRRPKLTSLLALLLAASAAFQRLLGDIEAPVAIERHFWQRPESCRGTIRHPRTQDTSFHIKDVSFP